MGAALALWAWYYQPGQTLPAGLHPVYGELRAAELTLDAGVLIGLSAAAREGLHRRQRRW